MVQPPTVQNRPVAPLTGDDVADLHLIADRQNCTWVNVHGLTVPYVVDPEARVVYLNGCLTLHCYFEALSQGLEEINNPGHAKNVVTMRFRQPGRAV